MIDRYSLSPMKDLWTEEAKFEAWLEVELAVCECWHERGRIPADEMEAIRQRAEVDVARIGKIEAKVRHDVIAFTTQLGEKIGPAARFVHMGLTSSDVVDTALALRLRRAGAILLDDLEEAHEAMTALALRHARSPMVGRTHGMHAEPTTMGLKALVWREEFGRHLARLDRAVHEVAVGKISGAVGTCAHTGVKFEEEVLRRLGLAVAKASTQVIQRDRHAQFVSALALVGASIEKIATEIRNLQRPEIRELEEPFAEGQKGSSAMPHKRNPVQCEQLTGLARVLRGHAMTALENVALWSERDISHSSAERIVLADATILADYMLRKLAEILKGLKVNAARMRENIGATRGLVFSQKVLLRLVERGLSREQAYGAVQAAAMRSWNGGEDFAGELLKEKAVAGHFTREQLEIEFDVESYLREVDAIFKRCGLGEQGGGRKKRLKAEG